MRGTARGKWPLQWCYWALPWSESQFHSEDVPTRTAPILAFCLLGIASLAGQTETENTPNPATEKLTDMWSSYFNVAGYLVPHDRSYASPAFSADHRHLHLGARYNYEDKETGSVWVGYNFIAGDKFALEVTPMFGGVLGNTAGVAPGNKASLGWRRLELSTEAEYVFNVKDHSGSFFYSWMEFS